MGSGPIPQRASSLAVSRVGVIVALPAEAASLAGSRIAFEATTALPGGHVLTVSGAGPERARRAAERLVSEDVDALLSWGCAAALAAHLSPGDLILPHRVHGADGSLPPVSGHWRAALMEIFGSAMPVAGESLTESPSIVADRWAKAALRSATGTVAVDMESVAVARVAHRHQRPFMAIRAVADSAGMNLPRAVLRSLDDRGDVALTKLLLHATRQPGQFVELARLGRAFAAATATLRRVRDLAGHDFALSKAFVAERTIL